MQIDVTMRKLKEIQEKVAKVGDLPGPRFEVHHSGDYLPKHVRPMSAQELAALQQAA